MAETRRATCATSNHNRGGTNLCERFNCVELSSLPLSMTVGDNLSHVELRRASHGSVDVARSIWMQREQSLPLHLDLAEEKCHVHFRQTIRKRDFG